MYCLPEVADLGQLEPVATSLRDVFIHVPGTGADGPQGRGYNALNALFLFRKLQRARALA